jgi:hypothetical protein
MAYSSLSPVATGELAPASWGNQVDANFDAAFPLGVDAWTAYTPTNTNVTLGNGTQVARYQRIGRTIYVKYNLTFGSTTSYGGNVSIGLPVAAAATGQSVGSVSILDTGTANYVGVALVTESATVATIHHSVPGSNAGAVNATAPMTWTTGDVLRMTVIYEAAT